MPIERKKVRSLVGEPFDVAEGENFFAAQIVAPHERAFVRFQARIFVHHVIGEIEIARHGQLEIVVKVVVIAKFCRVRKAVQKIHRSFVALFRGALS